MTFGCIPYRIDGSRIVNEMSDFMSTGQRRNFILGPVKYFSLGRGESLGLRLSPSNIQNVLCRTHSADTHASRDKIYHCKGSATYLNFAISLYSPYQFLGMIPRNWTCPCTRPFLIGKHTHLHGHKTKTIQASFLSCTIAPFIRSDKSG